MSPHKTTGYGEIVVRSSEESTTEASATFVVKDDKFSEVDRGTLGAPLSLPPGLYSVETFAPSGAQLSQLVRVEKGTLAEVQLEEAAPSASNRSRPTARRGGRSHRSLKAISREELGDSLVDARADSDLLAALPPGGLLAEPAESEPVTIDTGHGWLSAVTTDTGWRFTPKDTIDAVPVVRVIRGEQAWDVSLPLNPAGYDLTRDCTIDLIDVPADSTATPFVVGIPAERGVAHFIEGQLNRSTLSADTSALDEATTLLRSKYDDPAAAALAGLTLNRFGLLLERAEWVENLAGDFDWLTDARILLAALLRDDEQRTKRDRGLRMLLTAATERPLYADGLSLALDLLQRWPDDGEAATRTAAIAAYGSLAAYTDWSSVSLVTRRP